MFISVVVPTYNRADTLKYVLPSLAGQSYPNDKYEIILCDSGSTDETKQLLKELSIPNLRHITVENRGRAYARNAGISHAQGDIILFTDADIIADKNLIYEHARMHQKHPDLAVVGCEVQVNSIDEITGIINGVKELKPIHPSRKRHLPWYFFLTGNASVSKESLLVVGPFDEDFKGYGHEDLELGYRLSRMKYHIVYNPKAVNYHLHPVSFEEKCGKMYQSGKATVKFYNKHHDFDIKLKLGYTPVSTIIHSLISPKGKFFQYCRKNNEKSSLCREIILQHYYITGIKDALKGRTKDIDTIQDKGEIEKEKVNKILVIRIDHLGDVICSLPFIKSLQDNFFNAQVDVIVSSGTQQALYKASFIHELMVYNPGYSKKEVAGLVNFLKNRKYDIAIALSPTSASYYLAYKSKAKRRFGWVYINRPVTAFATKFALTDPLYMNYEKLLKKGEKIPHEVEQTLDLAEKMGVKISDDKLFIDISEDERLHNIKQLELLKYSKCIGLHLSHKWFSTDFLDRDFTTFVEKLLDHFRDYTLIITAGPEEVDYVDIFKDRIKSGRILFLKELPFKVWASVLSYCRFVITMDTGATHVAAAAGVSVACVFEDGKYDKCSQQWYPWGVKSLLYKKRDIKQLKEEDFKKMEYLTKDEEVEARR
ncbi:MAG: glycosyltransferase [Armatimonadota bacterium]